MGATLTVSSGSWTSGDQAVLTYRWQRCVGRQYAPEVLADSPAAYYRLGDAAESPDATDATGSELLGTFRNGVVQEADGGPFEDGDGAVSLDGVDDLVEVPDTAGLDLGDSFTLEAWIRPAGARAAALLDKGPGAYALRLDAANRVVLSKPGSGDVATATTAVPADGAYHHVVVTKDGAAVAVYLGRRPGHRPGRQPDRGRRNERAQDRGIHRARGQRAAVRRRSRRARPLSRRAVGRARPRALRRRFRGLRLDRGRAGLLLPPAPLRTSVPR